MTVAITRLLLSTIDSASLTTSTDGRYVAYRENKGSPYMWLVSQDHIVVHDSVTGTSYALHDRLGAAFSSTQLLAPQLSGDGQSLLFSIQASRNAPSAVALFDQGTGAWRYVSTAADGTPGNGSSSGGTLSSDGRFVAFTSDASNLVAGDTNGVNDVFVKDTLNGAIRRVSTGPAGLERSTDSYNAGISKDGALVLYYVSKGTALEPAYDLFALRLASGEATLVSTNSAGAALDGALSGVVLSGDGRYAGFTLKSVSAQYPDGYYEVFRKDLQTGELVRASTMGDAGGSGAAAYDSRVQSISDDGRLVTFISTSLASANLPSKVFVKDMSSGVITQAWYGEGLGQDQYAPVISGDGEQLYFTTQKSYLQYKLHNPHWLLSTTLVDDKGAPVTGTAHDETFTAHAGNQIVDGGAGRDTAGYLNKVADYTVSKIGKQVAVVDHSAGRDGSDLFTSIERIRFSDGAIAFDVDGSAGQAYRVYQAAFNRTPDQVGLGYWINRLDLGFSLDQVATGFVTSSEFKTLYGSAPSNAELVNLLYQNVLHRAGDAGGVAYWNDVLDRNLVTVGQVLADFSESPENTAALVGVLDQGMAYQFAALLF